MAGGRAGEPGQSWDCVFCQKFATLSLTSHKLGEGKRERKFREEKLEFSWDTRPLGICYYIQNSDCLASWIHSFHALDVQSFHWHCVDWGVEALRASRVGLKMTAVMSSGELLCSLHWKRWSPYVATLVQWVYFAEKLFLHIQLEASTVGASAMAALRHCQQNSFLILNNFHRGLLFRSYAWFSHAELPNVCRSHKICFRRQHWQVTSLYVIITECRVNQISIITMSLEYHFLLLLLLILPIDFHITALPEDFHSLSQMDFPNYQNGFLLSTFRQEKSLSSLFPHC